MIINRNGQLIHVGPAAAGVPQYTNGQRPAQGPLPGQAPALPPNLLAGGAATNPPAMTQQPHQQALPNRALFSGPSANTGPIYQPRPQSSPIASIAPAPTRAPAGNGMINLPAQANPFNPSGIVGGQGVYNPIFAPPANGMPPGQSGGLGNPFLFPTQNPSPLRGPPAQQAGTSQSIVPSMVGGRGNGTAGAGTVSNLSQSVNPANIAQQLQQARDAANAANQQRYQQQLDLNASGQQTQLGDLNSSFGALQQMPGQSAQRQQQILQNARQDQLGAIGNANQSLQSQAQNAGTNQSNAATSAYGGLLNQADQRAHSTQGFVDRAYGNLSNTAAQGGAQSMNFLNQQNQGMQGLLNNYSNADYAREHQQTQDQLGQIALDMADRGLASDTLDQSLKRGVYDDSALRQGEISDRRLGRALDVANSYTGRGLGVMGETNQQQFAAGNAYANAGLGARQNADATALNIAGRGVDTSLDARRSADQSALGIGQSFANQDINTRGDLNRAGLNVAADEGARQQGISAQYANERQSTLANSNNQRIGIIGARTDQGPDESAYFNLLSQAGANGRAGVGVPITYNPQGGGHVARGANPFGDPFAFAGGGGGGSFSGASNNSSYNPSAGYNPNVGIEGMPETNGLPKGDPNDPLNEGPTSPGQVPWWMYGGDYAYPYAR